MSTLPGHDVQACPCPARLHCTVMDTLYFYLYKLAESEADTYQDCPLCSYSCKLRGVVFLQMTATSATVTAASRHGNSWPTVTDIPTGQGSLPLMASPSDMTLASDAVSSRATVSLSFGKASR